MKLLNPFRRRDDDLAPLIDPNPAATSIDMPQLTPEFAEQLRSSIRRAQGAPTRVDRLETEIEYLRSRLDGPLAGWEVAALDEAALAVCGQRNRGWVCNDEPGHLDDHSHLDAIGRPIFSWSATKTLPGGEGGAATPDATGETLAPGDTSPTVLAARAEDAIEHLARELAHVAVPDADWDALPDSFRAIYRRYVDCVVLTGWRPPTGATP